MQFRFAIISDPHIAIPQTIDDVPSRFHLVEVSIPAFEQAIERLEGLDLDFLLIPGDLTQDGEAENHDWLQQRLKQLPFPAYVVPGNHDVPFPQNRDRYVGLENFSNYYGHCGYDNPEKLYYTQELMPGLQLIGLNSNQFDDKGRQIGRLDEEQLEWLEVILPTLKDKQIFVMIHHNVIEHLPKQSQHELGRRYMLENSKDLLKILKKYGVKLIFTGHLHVQDLAYQDGIYEMTTGSLVSYPHPYRIIEGEYQKSGKLKLTVQSHRVESVPGWEDLSMTSRQFLGDRSAFFMSQLLTLPPLNLSKVEAEKYIPSLQYFWADIAGGDGHFDFPEFPPLIRYFFHQFSVFNRPPNSKNVDNNATLLL